MFKFCLTASVSENEMAKVETHFSKCPDWVRKLNWRNVDVQQGYQYYSPTISNTIFFSEFLVTPGGLNGVLVAIN